MLEFSVITKTDADDVGIPATIIAKIDNGERQEFDAVSYRHNEQYLGFRSTDQDAIKKLVEDIGEARKTALFGLNVEAAGWKSSVNPGVYNSTKSVATFRKACID